MASEDSLYDLQKVLHPQHACMAVKSFRVREQLAETIDRNANARFRETELRAAVAEAVYDLPEKVRTVAVLYYLEMWTIKEIAEEIGLAVGTVKTRLREIRTLLRKELVSKRLRGKQL